MTRFEDVTSRGADAVARACPHVSHAFDRADGVIAKTRARMGDAKTAWSTRCTTPATGSTASIRRSRRPAR